MQSEVQPTVLPNVEIEDEVESELEPLVQVVIHNDPVTPMDFVVHVLKTIFHLANDAAAEIMLQAHFYGSAYVQSLPKPEARRRVDKAHAAAQEAGFPLQFSIQPES